jgi:hypothetical protein
MEIIARAARGSRGNQRKWLFRVVIVRRRPFVATYALEVAFRVHNVAFFVRGFVPIQVYWLAAHRAGKLSRGHWKPSPFEQKV